MNITEREENTERQVSSSFLVGKCINRRIFSRIFEYLMFCFELLIYMDKISL